MGVFRNVLLFFSGGQTRNKGIQDPTPGSYDTPSATNVTTNTALQLSAVWACTRLITEAISSLPINIFQIDSDGTKTLDRDHYLARLFQGKINKWQTRQEYFETITYQFALLGNNYSIKNVNGRGEVISLIPLMTPQMQVELLEDGEIKYIYLDDKGRNDFTQDQIWHNRLFGNGIIGLSPLAFARNPIGVGQAAEKATTNIYKNGGKASGILTIDRILKKHQRAAVKKNFTDITNGSDDRLFLLEADMKFTQVSLSPQDIELLASRQFQIQDICRFWGVPSVLVNDPASTAWGTGISQILQGFFKFGLKPYLTRYQASMEANLLKIEERGRVKIEFDTRELLMPEQKERIKASKEGVTGGIITPNEARKMEGLPAVEGGDCLIVQQQMVPLSQIKDLERGKVAGQTGESNNG